jgi:hypothetical protein
MRAPFRFPDERKKLSGRNRDCNAPRAYFGSHPRIVFAGASALGGSRFESTTTVVPESKFMIITALVPGLPPANPKPPERDAPGAGAFPESCETAQALHSGDRSFPSRSARSSFRRSPAVE